MNELVTAYIMGWAVGFVTCIVVFITLGVL